MNHSDTLCFCPWDKPEVEFKLLDWRPHEGMAFVVGADKRRQVFRFVLPGVLSQACGELGFSFPRAVPTKIVETCLLPPPCRTTEREAKDLIAAAAEARLPSLRRRPRESSHLPNWELVWLRHRNEVLLPVAEDHVEFEKRLEVFKIKKRREYEARKQELDEWRTKTIGQMIYGGGGRFYRELRNYKERASLLKRVELHLNLLETMFTRPLHEFGGRLHGGFLNWTLEVAGHEPIIRDPVLHERWARKHHLKLAEMWADKEAFLKWYRAHGLAPPPHVINNLVERMCPGASTRAADEALCAEVRFVVYSAGSRVCLADCPQCDPLLTVKEQRPFDAPPPVSTPVGQPTESTAAPVAKEREKLEAVVDQLGNKTNELAKTIAPLNKLYSDVELAEIRKRAKGHGVPELLTDWILGEFMSSDPPRLPTKGDVFNHCGPGTTIGEKLEQAGCGISKQRFADHLTVIRRLLEEKGWLARRAPGKSRKRESYLQPDERYPDFNQPTPAESAGDRDEGQQTAVLDTKKEGDQGQGGDSH